MKFRNLKEIIKGTLGIILITSLGIAFFTVISLNKAVESEVEKGNEFAQVLEAGFNDELLGYINEILDFSKETEIVKIIENDGQGNINMAVLSKLFFDQASIYFKNNETIKNVALEMVNDNETQYLYWPVSASDETVEWSIYKSESDQESYHYKVITQKKKSLVMIKIPLLDKNNYKSIDMIVTVNLNDVLSEIWQSFGYYVNLVDDDSRIYINRDEERLKKHLINLDLKNLSENQFFSLGEKNRMSNGSNYKDNELFFIHKMSENYYLTLVKPYKKISLINIQKEMYTHILIYILMGVGILGFLIFNHAKTKKWIEKDRTFLNEIIDLDKIQISELKKDVGFYQTMLNETPSPIFVIDKQTLNIIGLNKKAIDFYGYSEEELLKLSLSDICRWEDNHGDDEVIEIVHTKANHEKEAGAIRLQEINFNDEEMLMVMLEFNHNAEAVEFNVQWVDILQNITDPIKKALEATKLIEQSSEIYEDHTKVIKHALNHILMKSNDVLSQKNYNSLQEKNDLEEFDLLQFLDELTRKIITQDENYNDISWVIKEKIGDDYHSLETYFIQSDKKKLEYVLLNLMGNASKYTREGQVILSVVLQKSLPLDLVTFKINDTGRGMSEFTLKNLAISFETPMETVESFDRKLSVSNKYVSNLGGNLSVGSILVEGTTFDFTLKLKAVKEQSKALVNYRILVVDDYNHACYLKELLEKEISSYVKVLTDEKQVFSEISNTTYDLLMIAENLTQFKGQDIIQLLKKSQKKKMLQLPVILMTSSNRESCEAYQVLNEVVEDQEIVALVEKAFMKKLLYPYLDLAVIDSAILCETYESVGGEIFYALLDKFLISSSETLQMIKHQIKETDYKNITSTLHKLKGSMSYFGSIICQKMLVELEQLAKDESIEIEKAFENFEKEFIIFTKALKVVQEKTTDL